MLDNQLFVKTAHNRVIYTKETARLKKNDSQTAFCKLLLPGAGAGFMPAHKECSTFFQRRVPALQGRPL